MMLVQGQSSSSKEEDKSEEDDTSEEEDASEGENTSEEEDEPEEELEEEEELALALAISRSEAEAKDSEDPRAQAALPAPPQDELGEDEALALALAFSQLETEDGQAPPSRNTQEGLEEDEALALALTFSQLETEDSQVRGPASSSRSRPSQRIQPAGDLNRELQCPICLEMFRRATTLGCGHTFCAQCFQAAHSQSNDRCPLCRAHVESATHCVALDNVIRSLVARQ